MFLFLCFFFLINCSTDELSQQNQKNVDFNLEENIHLKQSSTEISNLFLKTGVTKINVTHADNSSLYEFETAKKFILNGDQQDFSDFTIVLDEGKIFLKSHPQTKLTLVENNPYIITEDYSGILRDGDFKKNEINLLLLFMKELTVSKENKINTASFITDNPIVPFGGCHFWNTYYHYQTEVSRSMAEHNLENDNESSLDDCEAMGEVDSSCLWENHGCVATQAYCC